MVAPTHPCACDSSAIPARQHRLKRTVGCASSTITTSTLSGNAQPTLLLLDSRHRRVAHCAPVIAAFAVMLRTGSW